MFKIFLIITSLVTVFLFSSCSKDKDNEESDENHLLVNGTKYDLSEGVYFFEGERNVDPQSFEFYVEIFSSGINLTTEGMYGKGNYISFAILSPESDQISDGKYFYDSSGKYHPFTFYESGYYLSFNFDDNTEGADIMGGIVESKFNGSVYEFIFDFYDEFGNKITGYYKGKLNKFFY